MATDLVDLKSWILGQSWGILRSNHIDRAKASKGLGIGGTKYLRKRVGG